MSEKVIEIETRDGPFQDVFRRVMRIIPERDRDDKQLQRLIAFRLNVDGEAATMEYLIHKIRDAIQCAYTGRMYDFLKNDMHEKDCDQ